VGAGKCPREINPRKVSNMSTEVHNKGKNGTTWLRSLHRKRGKKGIKKGVKGRTTNANRTYIILMHFGESK